MVNIWREKSSVRFGNVDRSDRLTLLSIFNFFQEAAISHAADLGVGRDFMTSAGQAWILSRLSLIVERRPSYGETIEISSWPRQWEKIFALRDYAIRDSEGNMAVRGRGSWLVLDIEKRKPLRVQRIMESLPPNDGIDAFPAGTISLNSRGNLVKAAERSALYSDIDYYGHANNVRYIQWIQDVTDPDILTKTDKARLDINYISEVKPGETVELWIAPLEDFVHGDSGRGSNGPRVISGENTVSADFPDPAGPGFAYEGRRPGSAEVPGQTVFRAELRTGG